MLQAGAAGAYVAPLASLVRCLSGRPCWLAQTLLQRLGGYSGRMPARTLRQLPVQRLAGTADRKSRLEALGLPVAWIGRLDDGELVSVLVGPVYALDLHVEAARVQAGLGDLLRV